MFPSNYQSEIMKLGLDITKINKVKQKLGNVARQLLPVMLPLVSFSP